MGWSWIAESLPGGLVLCGAILSALGGFLVLTQQNRFEKDMRTKAEETLQQALATLEQTQEAIQQIVGGDSYCQFYFSGSTRNQVFISVAATGKYPLYDVTATIEDQARPTERRTVTLGNVNRYVLRDLPAWDLGPGDTQRFAISFSARNGYFIQFLTFRLIDGGWVPASRVEREGKVIEGSERITNTFPRDEHGQVQW